VFSRRVLGFVDGEGGVDRPLGWGAPDIAAPLEVVWDLISDITRIGEWNVESRSCEWLAGATDPMPGARCRRRNRRNATL
jgi:hypothetical protein